MTAELKKRYNVHDVAKVAGVSAMTVTRAFDGSAPVAPATHKKIMAVAEKLNYRPSRMARTLRQGRSQSIGVLWSLSGPHDSVGVVRQITQLAKQAGYVTYLSDTMSDPGLLEDCLTDLLERKVDGLILQVLNDTLIAGKVGALLREIKQVVLVANSRLGDAQQFDLLHRNIMHGTEECLSALYRSGRRKIGLLYTARLDDIKVSFADRPFNACLDYLQVKGDHTKKGFRIFTDSLKSYIDAGKQYDAICCSSDEGAAQVINFLHDRGLRVPEDVAVCGVNNTVIAECFRPRIASIERKNKLVAKTVVEMLLQRMANPSMPPRLEEIAMEFIPRESAGLK